MQDKEMPIFRRTMDGFVPANEKAETFYQKTKYGDLITLEAKKPRNAGHHRKFFAMVGLVFESQELFDNQEFMRQWLTMAAGHFDTYQTPTGKKQYIPKSIAWAKMDQNSFEVFYEDFMNAVWKHIWPTGTEKDKANFQEQLLAFA